VALSNWLLHISMTVSHINDWLLMYTVPYVKARIPAYSTSTCALLAHVEQHTSADIGIAGANSLQAGSALLRE
jgi:hypothetical protein